MTESASTPRLRATFAIYLALIVATAVIGPHGIPPTWHYATGLVGFGFVAVACLGRIWCSLFIAGHKDEVLVTTGPYALCRHPLYAFSVLGALGLGLTSRSVLLCILVVALISALVVYAASCEEQFLADTFPDEFKAYVAATPNKWLPASRKSPLPATLDVRPAVFWKAFLDAGSFFLLWLLVALAAEFRTFHNF
ncbi:MAG TPA: isoprenylcysteine carboxylmethyltransferase family protein [Steroidobacteraceae bacterium]|nr:isoprenylcysteine carboxylmethyltransferase family protein [Steroidobacteraceae bacterium]